MHGTGQQLSSKTSSEFSLQVQLNNMLKDFLNLTRKMADVDDAQTFDLNLNIFAKDEHESVLAERWSFAVKQNSISDIVENVQETIR